MKEQKYHLYLSKDEYSEVLQSLIRLKNSLIAQGRYTDAVDDILCGCKNTVYIDDKLFYSQIHSIISRVIAEPALLNMLSQENSLCALTPEVMRADKEIDRMTERKNIDFLPVKKAIFSNVSDKFDCCTLDRAKAFSGVLMQYYGEQTASDTINIRVLEDTVDKITVDENGIVSVEFLNGCRISKEDSNGNSSNTQTENYN